MSLYGLAEDLFIVREALREAEEDDDYRLWIEFATLGVASVGAGVSLWSCVRHSYDTRETPGVSTLSFSRFLFDRNPTLICF